MSSRDATLSAAYQSDLSQRIAAYNAHVTGTTDPDALLTLEGEVVRFELERRRRVRPADKAVRWLVPHDGVVTTTPSERTRRIKSAGIQPRLRSLIALWVLSLRADVNMDRLGTFWWFAEPLIHVLLITITVLFLHGGDVHDMPSFPFAVIGVVVWLTFRNAFTASVNGPASLTPMLDHPSLTRFEVLVVRSTKGLAVNSMVGLIILSVAIFLDWTRPPENILLVLSSLLVAVSFGLALGLIAHYGALHYSGLRKVYGFVLRIVSLISGLFFVSEQVPGAVADYVLWNPLLHVSQFARSGWFDTYESRDASAVYMLGCLCGVLTLGLACAISTRRERARRGETA